MTAQTPVLLDCDNAFGLLGRDIDDGLALMALLGAPDIALECVTLTFGNASLPAVRRATARLCQNLDATVSVHAGAETQGHGDTPAARALAERAAAQPGRLTLIASGPLTNVAAAMRLDPNFLLNLKALHVMGGRAQRRFVGWRPQRELNFTADPAAALTVLRAAGQTATTVHTLEACLSLPLFWSDLSRLRALPGWFTSALWRWLALYGGSRSIGRIYLWDLLPVISLIAPEPAAALARRWDLAQLANGILSHARGDGGVAGHEAPPLTDPAAALDALIAAWHAACHGGSQAALPRPYPGASAAVSAGL